MNKKKRNQQQRAALEKANEKSCRTKRKFPDSEKAWEYAEYYYILYGDVVAPYKCVRGNHFHLTTNTTIGDLTHIPEEYRELFATENQEIEDSIFNKIHRFLTGKNETRP